MSGPVAPPLEVSDEADGGSVSGRPITTIEVTDGTLTVSGRTATIDTSGSGGSPGTPAKAVQFNSDPAGTFTGSAQLLYETGSNLGRLEMKTGASATQAEIRAMEGHGLSLIGSDLTGGTSAPRNKIYIYGENDTPDGISLDASTRTIQVSAGGISTSGASADLILSTYLDEDKAKITLEAGADGGIVLQTDNAGVTQLENTTTDADSVLSIMGNGTGDAKLDLQNASKRVWVLCDENKKLKIQGGSGGNTFILDVSGAATGLTFPDGSTQTTAATGGGGGFSPKLPQTDLDASNQQCPLAQIVPYGSTNTTTYAMYASASGDKLFCQPFIAPITADISDLIYYINSETSSACNLIMGLYSDDAGVPDAMIGKASADISTAGTKTLTSFTDFGGSGVSLSITEGTQYWIVFTRSVTSLAYTYQGINSYALPAMSFGGYPGLAASWCAVLRPASGSQLTLPETITATDLEPFSARGRIDVMAKFS